MNKNTVILANTKLKEVLKWHPELKESLLALSPKAQKLNNPLMVKTVGQFADMKDISQMLGISLCEVLHTLNGAIGQETQLLEAFPDCIKSVPREYQPELHESETSKRIVEIMDLRQRSDFFLQEILDRVKKLGVDEILVVRSEFDPLPLKNLLGQQHFRTFTKEVDPDTFDTEISRQVDTTDWRSDLDRFELLDLRTMQEDPFSTLLKKAQSTRRGSGFGIIQYFRPTPLINMIEPLGFETETIKKSGIEFQVYFYKTLAAEVEAPNVHTGDHRLPLVIQSATPVLYPILMELLKDAELMDRIIVKELKVWRETEKHMGWIVNGYADISFSAVVAAAKLFLNGADIVMPSVDVWDNFYILTRGYEAHSFKELQHKTIHAPLFKNAPPFAVTSYILKKMGCDPESFDFQFGKPFGRPEQIRDDFVSGKVDTVMLREPEASEALAAAGSTARVSIAYSDYWKKIHPELGNLPNAGLTVKRSLWEKEPDLINTFVKALVKAIEKVKSSPAEAAQQSADIMGQSPAAIELFLSRVHFSHQLTTDPATQAKIMTYLQVLEESDAIRLKKNKNNISKLWRI